MTQTRVIVVGDIILDQTTRVRVRGPSPEDDTVSVVEKADCEFGLGGAANVARNVSSLGGKPLFLGHRGGTFADSDLLLGLFRKAGVECITDYNEFWGVVTKERLVTDDNRYMLRVDYEPKLKTGREASYWKGNGVLPDAFHTALRSDDAGKYPVVCLVDYDKGLFTDAACWRLMWEIDRIHESFRFPVLVDPGRSGNWHRFTGPRTIFKVNLKQTLQHYYHARAGYEDLVPPYCPLNVPGRHAPPDAVREFACDVASRVRLNLTRCKTEFKDLVITLGRMGCVVCCGPKWDELRVYHPVEHSVSFADPCGAGDSFLAGMAVDFSRADSPTNWDSVSNAARVGNNVARVAVSRPGVYAVTKEDMQWD